jgi:2-hydroxy-3-keto-5-methylthiopentenyl-1-phosphate phosphatase
MRLVVLCDFDGTITIVDTAEWILSKYAHHDWRGLDKQFEKGEVSLEECLNKQFSNVQVSKNQVLKDLENVVVFRQGFKDFVEYCRHRGIPIVIVSAGLDFVIDYFLRKNGFLGKVEVCTAKTEEKPEGFTFSFPQIFDGPSQNFKPDVVRSYREKGFKVVFVGDGLADYAAAREADYSFAVQGSNLAGLCKQHGMKCTEMTRFQELIKPIDEIVDHE